MKINKRRKPDRDKLDQFIYDYGMDEALDYFQLTDKQAENILFSPVIDRKKGKVSDIESILEILVDINMEKAFPIYLTIRDNYSDLKRRYIWSNDTQKINVRSENQEDKFHNALIRVMTNLSRFEYVDEKTTLEYVKSRLFFQTKADRKQKRNEKKMNLFHNLRDSEYVEQLINNLPYEEATE